VSRTKVEDGGAIADKDAAVCTPPGNYEESRIFTGLSVLPDGDLAYSLRRFCTRKLAVFGFRDIEGQSAHSPTSAVNPFFHCKHVNIRGDAGRRNQKCKQR